MGVHLGCLLKTIQLYSSCLLLEVGRSLSRLHDLLLNTPAVQQVTAGCSLPLDCADQNSIPVEQQTMYDLEKTKELANEPGPPLHLRTQLVGEVCMADTM